MKREVISDRQGITLIILFIFGSTVIIGTGGSAKQNAWIAVLLSAFFALPIVYLYSRILARFPEKDLFDILEITFGRAVGKLFSLVFVWFAFHLGALVLRNFGDFISSVALPETPKIVPMIIYGFICIYGVRAGIETLSRCGEFFVIVVILLVIFSTLMTMPILEPDNLRPVLEEGIMPVLSAAFSAITFPFAESVVFLMVFSALKSSKSSLKVYALGIIIPGVLITMISARNMMILGPIMMESAYFPSYTALSRINIGNFLQRLEIAVTIAFLLTGFIKISICLLGACKGASKILGFKDYRPLVVPIGLLMVNLGYLVYDNMMEMFEWAFEVWPYYAVPFQFILPALILLVIEIKHAMKKRSEPKEDAI